MTVYTFAELSYWGTDAHDAVAALRVPWDRIWLVGPLDPNDDGEADIHMHQLSRAGLFDARRQPPNLSPCGVNAAVVLGRPAVIISRPADTLATTQPWGAVVALGDPDAQVRHRNRITE